MAQLRAGKGRRVRRDPQGQGARDFSRAAGGPRTGDATGNRRAFRYQPRASAPDRGAPQEAAERVPQIAGGRYRPYRALTRAIEAIETVEARLTLQHRSPCRAAIAVTI